MTLAEMERLTTPRLLAYKNSLYEVTDGSSHEETIYGGTDFGMHKQRPEWQEAVTLVKSVLSRRDNV